MLPEPIGRLPLILARAPFPGETVRSFACRLDKATGVGCGHLWGLARLHPVPRGTFGATPCFRVRGSGGGRSAEFVPRTSWGARGCSADARPPAGLAWHACQLCTRGKVIERHPGSARLACPEHQVWTGPSRAGRLPRARTTPLPSADHSSTVPARIVDASAKLVASGASAELVWEVFRRAAGRAGLVCPDNRVRAGPTHAGRARRTPTARPPAGLRSNPVNDRVVQASVRLYPSGAEANLSCRPCDLVPATSNAGVPAPSATHPGRIPRRSADAQSALPRSVSRQTLSRLRTTGPQRVQPGHGQGQSEPGQR